MKKEKAICYTCKSCKINSHGYVYCSLRKRGEQCINYDKWESRKDALDKLRADILEYINDLDIANGICAIFDKYEAEVGDT